MEALMKGIFKIGAIITTMAMLNACSSGYVTIAERDSYAQPTWYAKCAETGTEGWFWWKEEYAYACGAGVSVFEQAAEEQMYAIAMNNFAKRINSTVNSDTKIQFKNNKGAETKETSTYISYQVNDTKIREHVSRETGTYKYAGQTYTFVKLSMKKETFDALLAEAKSRDAIAQSN
tara:strand:- start:5025 stop:5552 length:528 start_codon:yes stop_codon:yes gene_type:complete